ncbi:MAG TPA: hypothetical protein VHX63_11380 [Acidobacteriaceae bacterium]|nr:hypothetical protein [Acidobacteriaceae bacterium]
MKFFDNWYFFHVSVFRLKQRALWVLCFSVFLSGAYRASSEQNENHENVRQLVQQVVDHQLAVDQNDHSRWMYRDIDKVPGKSTVKLIVQTSQGTVSKTIEINGQPPTSQQRQQEEAQMENLVDNPSALAKQRKNSAHDDEQSTSLMKMLPDAFLWTKTGESNGEVTLHFEPNPAFHPPTYASRVFAAMAGDMVVDPTQKILRSLSGTLIHPVEFADGLFGKIEQGGTFRVVRSQIAPGEWQITETHVHIHGYVLIFKSIDQQEDDETSNYKPSPASLTLRQAIAMLNNGSVASALGLKSEP